jgi:hypothetical protein
LLRVRPMPKGLDLVQRLPAARSQTAKGHAPARPQAAHREEDEKPGALIVTILSGSILADGETQPPDVRCKFTIRVTSTTRGASKPVKREHAGVAPVKFALRPGSYRIDVMHEWQNHEACFPILYPDGASVAYIESKRTTRATVILATDTLGSVASAGKLHIGVQGKSSWDATFAPRLEQSLGYYNAKTIGLEWYTFQNAPSGPLPAPPGAPPALQAAYAAFPLSAPLVEYWTRAAGKGVVDFKSLQDDLALNGWHWDYPSWSAFATETSAHKMDYTPACALYTNYGQLATWAQPPWFVANPKAKAPPLPEPPTCVPAGQTKSVTWAAIMKDHVAATMGVVSCLSRPNNLYSSVAPPPLSWIVVNEVLDNSGPGDVAFWFGGGPYTKAEVAKTRNELMLSLFQAAHSVCPDALLIENDFNIEFVPPPKQKKGGRPPEELPPKGQYGKSGIIYETMKYSWKNDPALHGHLGIGYEMHFEWMPEYAKNPLFFRTCFLRGLGKYARLGMPVVITEMTIAAYPPVLRYIPAHRTPPAPNPNAGKGLSTPIYNQYRYQVGNCTEERWRQQAFVYRDIVRTFYKQPNCDTLYTFCGYDEPADELSDCFGHLFDAGPADETSGAFTDSSATPFIPKPAYFGALNGLIEAVDFKHPKEGPGRHVRGREPPSGRVPNWLRRYHPG